MNNQTLPHIIGGALVLAGGGILGWAPHNNEFGVLLIFVGAILLMTAAQLSVFEKALGKLPEASSLIGLLQQAVSSSSLGSPSTSTSASNSPIHDTTTNAPTTASGG